MDEALAARKLSGALGKRITAEEIEYVVVLDGGPRFGLRDGRVGRLYPGNMATISGDDWDGLNFCNGRQVADWEEFMDLLDFQEAKNAKTRNVSEAAIVDVQDAS